MLQELIDGGLEELFVAYRAAATVEGSPADRLRAACAGYLDFAANRPGLFQLVFESDGFNATAVTSSEEAPSFMLFTEMVADAGPAIAKHDRVEAATLCWSIIHGYASLKSHAELPRIVDADSLRIAVLDTAVRAASEWGQPR